jgi:hypothetical protein
MPDTSARSIRDLPTRGGTTVKKTCEIWLIVDEDGNYECSGDRSTADELFNDNIGGTGPRRVVKLTVQITPPQVDDAQVDVADNAGEQVEASAE